MASEVFPTITPTTTDTWLDFWNVTFREWAESSLGSSSSWPSKLTGNGRVTSVLGDTLLPRKTTVPSLSIVLPQGLSLVVSGKLVTTDSDIIIGDIPENFEGWLVLTLEYDEGSESDIWDFESFAERPLRGAGAVVKIKTLSDRVDTLSASLLDTDVIPTIPVLLQYLSGGGSSGSDGGSGSGVDPDELARLRAKLDKLAADFEAFKLEVLDDRIVAAPMNNPTLMLNSAKQIAVLVNLNPTSSRHFKAGIDMPGVTGYAQDWNGVAAPLQRIGGNCEYDEVTGVIR